MTWLELMAVAAPTCVQCTEPVQRIEQRWVLQGDEWVPDTFVMVCSAGHREEVKHFGEEES